MIVVIADDFTGAAELAGLGLRYGLRVEMSTVVNQDTDAELLIIATDTRSVSKDEARQEMEKATCEILKLKPELIFKKVDSVLRGHILAELTAQLNKEPNIGVCFLSSAKLSINLLAKTENGNSFS